MKKVVVVKRVDNVLRIEVVDAPEQNKLLDFLYEKIGCTTVQMVYFNNCDAWVNEERLFESGLSVYGYATKGHPRVQLAGNVVFTKGVNNKGNTTFFDDTDQSDMNTILDIYSMVADARYIGQVR